MNHNPYEEEDDDKPVGRLLTRREMLAVLGGLAGVFVVGCDSAPATATTGAAATSTTAAAAATATGTALSNEGATAVAATPVAASPTADSAAQVDCVVKPDLTEGPYFVDENLNRSDIRTDSTTGTAQEGLPLALTFMVSQVASNACTPLEGAQVDIWHCSALGVYSDVSDPNWDTTEGQDFLRGFQNTDSSGKASFTTIYPGWYSGRAVHIHFKIRTTGTDGNAYEFTSQLFFDDSVSDQVFATGAYASKGPDRDTLNSNDNIYSGGGDQLLLTLTGDGTSGYAATMGVALDLSDTESGASDSAGSGGPGGGPGGPPPR